MSKHSCCTPATLRTSKAADSTVPKADTAPDIPVVTIPAGTALKGTDHPALPEDEEGPARKRPIKAFHMMQTTVTNAMFAAFVDDTGYRTEAEEYGWSFVFYRNISPDVPATQGAVGTTWWRKVDGADWRVINGPGSQGDWDADHPVTHVSWRDGRAFAAWAGGRLPTEAEWEHAARGGLGDVPFPWGTKEPDDTGHFPCNIWQGVFPDHNTAQDGYLTTAPARSFAPNGYGLFNMCGNVWEWTSEPMKLRSLSKAARERMRSLKGAKLLKGGSFLCHKSYCFRYRIPARTFTTPDTTTNHQGFRLVFDTV
ncbi:formylglycine-generating enzyme family protein [Sulfitobacter aestuariivivens]|nr:formylglycine-generating enzyme family protein [Sulfitobacter aestuariivivens]